MSKLKHDEMEQDVLIEYSTRFLYFYRNNKGVVWGTGIGIVLAVGLTIGYFVHTAQQTAEAEELLGTAEEYLMQGEYDRALYGDEEAFTLGFIQIADNYSRTPSGNLANYYSAAVLYEIEEYEEALHYIVRFRVPDGITGVGPISLHAAILAELERYVEAAEMFVEAAYWDENDTTTPYNLYEAAIAYQTAGNIEEAVSLLETIIDEYPDSDIFSGAQRLKGRLTARN